MTLTRENKFELVGGIVALAIAYAGVALGLFSLGRLGVLVLVLSVPAGVVLGWILIKLLDVAHRILDDTE